jgi:hypothetical protein
VFSAKKYPHEEKSQELRVWSRYCWLALITKWTKVSNGPIRWVSGQDDMWSFRNIWLSGHRRTIAVWLSRTDFIFLWRDWQLSFNLLFIKESLKMRHDILEHNVVFWPEEMHLWEDQIFSKRCDRLISFHSILQTIN